LIFFSVHLRFSVVDLVPMLPSRPCLALPFTFLPAPGRVHLLAGEDFRYTLAGPGLDDWLPGWLSCLDGTLSLEQALERVPGQQRNSARDLLARLYGERIVIDGPARSAHLPVRYQLAAEGSTPWQGKLAPTPEEAELPALPTLCQDRLDYHETLRFNQRCLAGGQPWFWVSTAALMRGYVSPAFLPEAGSCLHCLLRHFQRLSPVPEFYAELIEHGRRGGTFSPSPFPPRGIDILVDVLRWKVDLLAEANPPAALFQLHVLEVGTLEVSAHRVFLDPECPSCQGRRRG
jgi:bacteriocin biosynthesis cyclodehydratase domain-containing protein